MTQIELIAWLSERQYIEPGIEIGDDRVIAHKKGKSPINSDEYRDLMSIGVPFSLNAAGSILSFRL